MYSPQHIISENGKTSCSINFPRKGHCRPTSLCIKSCYARSGPMTLPNAKRKQQFVSDYFADPTNDLLQIIWESRQYQAVRLNGSGDMLLSHIKNILKLAKACPKTMFYGMTRKPEIATAINNQLDNLKLLLTIDATTPLSVWKNYPRKMVFGPRRAIDKVPTNKQIIVVFPYHCHGKVIQGIPAHKKDCLAIYHKVSGCMVCQRCWNW